MKIKNLATLLCLALCGCSATNSLILHPLSVVWQQHKYNEQAAANKAFADPATWPKRSFTNDSVLDSVK